MLELVLETRNTWPQSRGHAAGRPRTPSHLARDTRVINLGISTFVGRFTLRATGSPLFHCLLGRLLIIILGSNLSLKKFWRMSLIWIDPVHTRRPCAGQRWRVELCSYLESWTLDVDIAAAIAWGICIFILTFDI